MIIQKITTGFVVQQFCTETGQWAGQEFVAGDYVEIEDDKGNSIDETEFEAISKGNDYLPFNMEQPA